MAFSPEFWTVRSSHFDLNESEQIVPATEAPTEGKRQRMLGKVLELYDRLRTEGYETLLQGAPTYLPHVFASNLKKLVRKNFKQSTYDLIEQVKRFNQRHPLTYSQICQIVPTNFTLASNPVHQSLLCYYTHWASLMQSGMKESREKKIEEVDQKQLLEWLYTRQVPWEEQPSYEDSEIKLREMVPNNAAALLHVSQIADKYGLEPLVAQCKLQLERLYRFAAALNDSPPKVSLSFLQGRPPLDFSQPASEALFHDVTFQIGRETVKGNSGVLSQNLFFRKMIYKGVQNLDAFGLSAPFFKGWIGALERGEKFPLFVITPQNALALLKIGLRRKECCDELLKKESLTDKEYHSIDHLTIDSGEQGKKFLEDKRFNFRSLDVQKVDEPLKAWLQEHRRRIRSLKVRGVDDEFLLFVARHCSHLQKLDVSMCRAVTDRSITALCKLKLRSLNLTHTRISEVSLKAFPSTLEVLNLSMCTFNVFSFPEMLQSCLNLRKLSVSGCNKLFVENLLIKSGPNPPLEELELEGLPLFKQLVPVAEQYPSLRFLNIRLTEIGDLDRVKGLLPHCKIKET